MRFRSVDELQQLVDHRIPESASLEYKEELALDRQGERLEALKDLTGMANGGGGTVAYGIREAEAGDWPVAEDISPLSDFGLIGRLENVVRDGVRPPLLVDYSAIEAAGGYVLSVDVQPSPLGPYMVEAYGHRRFHHRVGTSTSPMTEQQVRDAYALAGRARDRRPELWASHALPMSPPSGDVWAVVSALPEEPLSEILDMRAVTASDLQPPTEMATYINNWSLGDLTPALRSLSRWVDGFHGDDLGQTDGVGHSVRLHRDGAATIASQLAVRSDGTVWPVHIARVVNTAVLYLGWFWDQFGLTRPVELRIELYNTSEIAFETVVTKQGERLAHVITGPAGISLDPVVTAEYVLPWEIRRASIRHGVVMRFADRLYQALGAPEAEVPFRSGLLHDRAGECINVSIAGDSVWDETAGAGGHIGWVHSDGSIVATRTGEFAAWYRDGVVMDLVGDTVAVLELAPGLACPDAFVGTSLQTDPSGTAHVFAGSQTPPHRVTEPPTPTMRWSSSELRELLGS